MRQAFGSLIPDLDAHLNPPADPPAAPPAVPPAGTADDDSAPTADETSLAPTPETAIDEPDDPEPEPEPEPEPDDPGPEPAARNGSAGRHSAPPADEIDDEPGSLFRPRKRSSPPPPEPQDETLSTLARVARALATDDGPSTAGPGRDRSTMDT
jgi:hypothetical protein